MPKVLTEIYGLTFRAPVMETTGATMSSGVWSGGRLVIINGPANQWKIESGRGVLAIDSTVPQGSQVAPVYWPDIYVTGLTHGSTETRSFVYLTQTNQVLQGKNEPSSDLLRNYIYLGRLIHPTGTLTSVVSEGIPIINQLSSLAETLFLFMGNMKKIDSFQVTANGTNLKLNISEGWSFILGSARLESAPHVPPNILYRAAYTAKTLRHGYISPTGARIISEEVDTLDVKHYTVNGVLDDVGTTNATIQTVLFYPQSEYCIVVYGDTLFLNLSTAKEAISTYRSPITKFLNGAVVIAKIALAGNCGSLLDNTCKIYQTNVFGHI